MTERKLDVLLCSAIESLIDWLFVYISESSFIEYNNIAIRYIAIRRGNKTLNGWRNARYGLNSLFILSKTAAFVFFLLLFRSGIFFLYVFDGWMIYSEIIGFQIEKKNNSNYGYWFWKAKKLFSLVMRILWL